MNCLVFLTKAEPEGLTVGEGGSYGGKGGGSERLVPGHANKHARVLPNSPQEFLVSTDNHQSIISFETSLCLQFLPQEFSQIEKVDTETSNYPAAVQFLSTEYTSTRAHQCGYRLRKDSG